MEHEHNSNESGWSARETPNGLEQEQKERESNLRIAIDGPAGTGKSSVARLLSEQLGIPLLNSGQIYRSIAYSMQAEGLDLDDPEQAAAAAASLKIKINNGIVTSIDGIDAAGILDNDSISSATPRVARHPGVRDVVVNIQREYVKEHGAVIEGRAIGTAVMPEADYKFYLACDPEERARRRSLDGHNETTEHLLERDRQDSEREHAPLRIAKDAVVIDTTRLSAQGVVEQMTAIIRTTSESET